MSLCVLLGAGYSQGFGIRGTAKLTELVRQLQSPTLTTQVVGAMWFAPVLPLLWKALSAYYNSPNFETMLHGIEALVGIQRRPHVTTMPDELRPIANAFMDVSPRWQELVDYGMLLSAAHAIVQTVADALDDDVSAVQSDTVAAERSRLTRLTSAFETTIIDLNFDDLVDTALPEARDGFDSDSPARFRYKNLISAAGPRLIHLHGSIRFGISEATVVKFGSRADARTPRSRFEILDSQSGDPVLVGALIAGLRKTDKINAPPYAYYHHAFVEELLRSPRLLIIGYGGMDLHVNAWLHRWLETHGDAARCAVVTPINREPKDSERAPPLEFISRVLGYPNAMQMFNTAMNRGVLGAGVFIQGRGMLVRTHYPYNASLEENIIAFLKS